MKHYYYSENNQQLGPFTFDELKFKRIRKSTLVWTEGMNDWDIAINILELKEIIISEPPPLPKKKIETKAESVITHLTITQFDNPKYDLTYEKEIEATFLGILLLAIPIIIKLTGNLSFETEESFNQTRAIFAIGTLVIRIGVAFWVVNIATRQNRNSTSWGWFAFFLPSIAMIIIGQLKKLKLKIELDSSSPIEEQISILKEKADNLKKDFRYNEALSLFMKIKELKNDYQFIDENIKECEFKINEIKQGLLGVVEKSNPGKRLISFKSNKGEIEIEYSLNAPEPGKMAFQNEQPAKTGKYKFGFMWYVHIDNGIITKISSL